jgi:hypothetical protein
VDVTGVAALDALVVTAVYLGLHMLASSGLAPLLYHWDIVSLPPAPTLAARTRCSCGSGSPVSRSPAPDDRRHHGGEGDLDRGHRIGVTLHFAVTARESSTGPGMHGRHVTRRASTPDE